MKKIFFIVVVSVIILAGLIVVLRVISGEDDWICVNGQREKHGNPISARPNESCQDVQIIGTITNVDPKKQSLSIRDNNQQEIQAISQESTEWLDENYKLVDFKYFQKGRTIELRGKFNKNKIFSPLAIRALPSVNIVVFSPQANQEITFPFVVRGVARAFENQFNVRILYDGKVIYQDSVYANAPDAGFFGDFSKEVTFPINKLPDGAEIILEVLDYSAKDGSEIDKVSIPLQYKNNNIAQIQVYFNNNNLDPEISCNKVFPVWRTIIKTPSLGRVALEELLKGPTLEEKNAGYLTSINSGVTIKKITIEGGIAKVDFDESLEKAVGGSCRVSAIRAQITQTLKQFPTVKDVVISVNDRVEDALQP